MQKSNLKVFFIKLLSISFAIILVINVLFNLIISDKLENLNTLLSLDELENRRALGNEIREDLKSLLEKDKLFKEEDRILIYKLYKKVKLEFKDIKE
ncbi:MAG: hypothetical protein CMG02_01310 [Candidatus Marinimicrobia bacterium]|nr:hypothetical protein [Candidatus Neomarinimicrobiota bacterium]RPG05223.1 MAG: hypothetical protein CBE07_002705 [Pelagibacteraceae bacterium TMED247]|tara:strand:- start:5475 stop:5765 length:291 start_codon:yes stop_codon:yes gene_type:complete